MLVGYGVVELVCNIGTNLDQPDYERCIAELPALQAQHDQDIRVGTAMRPAVALAGGVIVALATQLIYPLPDAQAPTTRR